MSRAGDCGPVASEASNRAGGDARGREGSCEKYWSVNGTVREHLSGNVQVLSFATKFKPLQGADPLQTKMFVGSILLNFCFKPLQVPLSL